MASWGRVAPEEPPVDGSGRRSGDGVAVVGLFGADVRGGRRSGSLLLMKLAG